MLGHLLSFFSLSLYIHFSKIDHLKNVDPEGLERTEINALAFHLLKISCTSCKRVIYLITIYLKNLS